MSIKKMINEETHPEMFNDFKTVACTRIDGEKLSQYYEILHADVSEHDLDCRCQLCLYFLVVGGELRVRAENAKKQT